MYMYILTTSDGRLAGPLLRFASACTRSFDHSINSQPASAKSHVPCSQARNPQSIVSDLPWPSTANPCWRHLRIPSTSNARDAFLQRHASPSSSLRASRTKALFWSMSDETPDVPPTRARASCSHITLVLAFPGFPTRMPYFGAHVTLFYDPRCKQTLVVWWSANDLLELPWLVFGW